MAGLTMPIEAAPGLSVGDSAPDFTAPTYDGGMVTLSSAYAKGPVVLIFYRGAWCPFCSLHLKSFQEKKSEFDLLGASIIAVSVDKPEYLKQMSDKNALSFSVVSDAQAEILKNYHVLYTVPAELAEKYKNEYQIDLEAHSGRSDHTIAVPATYVIAPGGKIIFAYSNEDYKVRTKPEEVLDVLKAMTGSQ